MCGFVAINLVCWRWSLYLTSNQQQICFTFAVIRLCFDFVWALWWFVNDRENEKSSSQRKGNQYLRYLLKLLVLLQFEVKINKKNSWEIATAKKCLGIAHSWCRNINPLSYATSKKKAYNFWIITYIHSSFSRFHSQCQIKFMYEHVLVLTRFSMSLPDTIWNSL